MRLLGSDPAVITKCYDVIDRIVNGEYLKTAIKNEGLTISLFHSAIQSERKLAVAYANAMELSADVLADEALECVDSDVDPAKARNQATVRQWLASKRNNKRYGERIDLNVSQTVSIDLALNQAKSRLLRPVSESLVIENAQPVDSIGFAPDASVDCESIPAAIPDIFS